MPASRSNSYDPRRSIASRDGTANFAKPLLFWAMRMRGLEPPRGFPHTDLNRARLPIPPHPRGGGIVASLGGSEPLLDGGDVPRDVALALVEAPLPVLEILQALFELVLAQVEVSLGARIAHA